MKKDELDITKIKADHRNLKDLLFSSDLNERERLQLACSHRNEDDTADTFIFDGNKTICKVCGASFNPDMKSKEVIEKTVLEVIDILEAMKIMDKNYKEHIEYYAITPMLKRLPEIFALIESEFNTDHPFPKTLNIAEPLNKFFKEGKANVVFNQSADQIFNVDHVDSIDDLDEI